MQISNLSLVFVIVTMPTRYRKWRNEEHVCWHAASLTDSLGTT